MSEIQFKITPCVEDGKIEHDSLLMVRVFFTAQPMLQVNPPKLQQSVFALVTIIILYFSD